MFLEVGFMLQNKKHNWYDNDFSYGSARPMVQVLPSEPLPFYPRSCGCFSYNRGFRRVENGAHKPMVHLFWGISGSGSFETVHGNFRFCGSRPPQKVVRIPPILQTASVRCRFICAPSGFSDSDTRILSLAHVIYTNGTHSCVAVMQFAESTTNC